ncbi:radical SAM family heme chaperone HemW [Verrucomicrobiota bacterium]
MSGLYIHIPFCVQKCRYCDFYSEACCDEARVSSFLEALDAELRQLDSAFVPTTLFFGGGTPTALSAEKMGDLLGSLKRHVDLSQVEEWSVEANPGTLTARKLELLCAAGVNRVSLGVQSFNDQRLEWLGRIHRARDVYDAVSLIRSFGGLDLNLDLMHSIPGVTLPEWEAELDAALSLSPQHISCYNLTFEPGTPLADMLEAGELEEPSEELQLAQFELTDRRLKMAGYEHYEISNYARRGHECRHNMLYWTAGDYIGCGPSAHSHMRGRRFANTDTLDEYGRMIRDCGSACDFEERLPEEARARETLVFGLRLLAGVNHYWFEEKTGYKIEELCGDEVERLKEVGLLEQVGANLRLTRAGLFVSNSVFAELV